MSGPDSPERRSATDAGIAAVGLMCSVGGDAAAVAAAVRAGINRFAESMAWTRGGEPVVLALVPPDALAEPSPSLRADDAPISLLELRLLRLAGCALGECLRARTGSEEVPVYAALPAGAEGRWKRFSSRLGMQVRGVSAARSRVFAGGHAAGVAALDAAVDAVATGREAAVVVLGVDSPLDAARLESLDRERRLRAGDAADAPIHGEAAAALLVTASRSLMLLRIRGIGIAEERGHAGRHPDRGEGLTAAMRDALAARGATAVATVYAGLNGEALTAREWSASFLRHRDAFAPDLDLQHPMDCVGDVGSAAATLLIGLAALGIARGYRRAPCLVWCGGGDAMRAAVLLDGATTHTG